MYSKLMSKQSNHEALDGIASDEERRITVKSTHSVVATIITVFWVIGLNCSLRYEKSLFLPSALTSFGYYFYHLVGQLFFLSLTVTTLALSVALTVGLLANLRSLRQLN